MDVEVLIFAIYAACGPIVWGFLCLFIFLGRKRLNLMKRPANPLPDAPPRVTILVPAKDEGERMRACLESIVAQDYPNYSVICINDRSKDHTGQIMEEFAARDPRVKAFHVQEDSLPAGWTGKCNALHSNVKNADGEWLLFVDSDVIIKPDAVSASMGYVLTKKVEMFSLLPQLESHSLWESLLVPLAATSMSTMYLIALSNHNHKENAFANGQFMLLHRSTYESIGGHEQVRDHFCEDVRMAKIVKSAGHKLRVVLGNEFAAVRMYSSLKQIFRGWSRLFYAVGVGSPWRIVGGMIFVLLCGFSAYAAMGYGLYQLAAGTKHWGYAWLATGAAHWLIMTIELMFVYRWSGNERRNALLFPLAGTMLIGIFLKSLWMCITGKVEWRGTQYTHRMTNSLQTKPQGRAA